MKNIAVFVSSTFADMQSERDMIREKVLPELEDRLKRFGGNIEFIDLRWGIDTVGEDEETSSKKIMRSCFDEIKRTEPFFIVLLGERYGWIPPDEETASALADEGLADDQDFKNRSVTEIEITFAQKFYSHNNKCLFYLRAPVDYGNDKNAHAMFVSHGEEAAKLSELKQKIRDTYPEQVREYQAHWEPSAQRIAGLDFLEQQIIEDIWQSIHEEFSADLIETTAIEEALNAQSAFINKEVASFSGRQKALSDLNDFIESDKKALLLLGNSGSGKTALLAKLTSELSMTYEHIYPFFAGTSQSASSIEFMLKMFIFSMSRKLGNNISANEIGGISDTALLCEMFYSLVNSIADKNKLIIILDAVNQMMSTELIQNFKWLNIYRLPKNVKLIFSCTTDYHQIARLSALCDISVHLDNLTNDDIAAISNQYFRAHHKELNDDVLKAITRKGIFKNPCRMPIYLLTLLQELNNIGADDFKKIDHQTKSGAGGDQAIVNHLKKLVVHSPATLERKLNQMFTYVCRKIGNDLCTVFVSMIAFSSHGVTEKLIENTCSALNIHFDAATFSFFRKLFRNNLLQRDNGAWDFNHSLIKSYYRKLFINTDIGTDTISCAQNILLNLDDSDLIKSAEIVRFSALNNNTLPVAIYLQNSPVDISEALAKDMSDDTIPLSNWHGFFEDSAAQYSVVRDFLLYAMDRRLFDFNRSCRFVCMALNGIYKNRKITNEKLSDICTLYLGLGKLAYATGHFRYAIDCYKMALDLYKKQETPTKNYATVYKLIADCHHELGNIIARNKYIRKYQRILELSNDEEAKMRLIDICETQIMRLNESIFRSVKKMRAFINTISEVALNSLGNSAVHATLAFVRSSALIGSSFTFSDNMHQKIEGVLNSCELFNKAELEFYLSDYFAIRNKSKAKFYLDAAAADAASALKFDENARTLILYKNILDTYSHDVNHNIDSIGIISAKIQTLKKIISYSPRYEYADELVRELYSAKPQKIIISSEEKKSAKQLRNRLVKNYNNEFKKLTNKMFYLTWTIIFMFYFVLPQIPFAFLGSVIIQLFGGENAGIYGSASLLNIYDSYLSACMQGTINTLLCFIVYGTITLLSRGTSYSVKSLWLRRTVLLCATTVILLILYYFILEYIRNSALWTAPFLPAFTYMLRICTGFMLLMLLLAEIALALSKERLRLPYRRAYKEFVIDLPYRLSDCGIRFAILLITVAAYYLLAYITPYPSNFMILSSVDFSICAAVLALVIIIKVLRFIIISRRLKTHDNF